MQPASRRAPVLVFLVTTLVVSLAVLPLTAQTQTPPPKPAPKPTPAQTKPAQTKPAPPAKPAATAEPAPAPATPTAAKPTSDSNCAIARANLARLQAGGTIGLDANGDGKPDAVMGDSERASQATLAERNIATFCDTSKPAP